MIVVVFFLLWPIITSTPSLGLSTPQQSKTKRREPQDHKHRDCAGEEAAEPRLLHELVEQGGSKRSDDDGAYNWAAEFVKLHGGAQPGHVHFVVCQAANEAGAHG